MSDKIEKNESEWRAELSPEQYHVCREHGTEPAFAGKYHAYKEKGVYKCSCCSAELFASDALHREESCGGHFREEFQTPEGEALRRDDEFAYAAAWEFNEVGKASTLHKEQLTFDYVKLATRSYK